MNVFRQFRNFMIGSALSRTEDVFEKSKIELTYNFTNFLFILALLFLGNLIPNGYSWETITTVFSIGMLLACIYFLNRSGYRKAAKVFVINQVIVSCIHFVWINGILNTMSVFWILVFILYSFFVLGTTWGMGTTLFTAGLIILGMVNKELGFPLFNFIIPEEQKVPESPFFILVPFSLNVYMIYQFVKLKAFAEKQISENKLQLELKNKDITDSINYARKIQYAVLPREETILRSIPLSFILYKPKDIVSGDFYWFHEIDRDNYIIVCADCTGHGVPGAMMTVIGSNLLNQTVIDNAITQPSQILLVLDNLINITLKQQKEHEHLVQDGMDLALLKVNKNKREIIYTGAKRSALLIRDKQLQELKGTKHTLGGMITGCKVFKETSLNYREDDMLYFYTDGYTDQFGGEKGKKFSSRRFRDLLMEIHRQPMPEQKKRLDDTIEKWRGGLEQVDDICVIGVRF